MPVAAIAIKILRYIVEGAIKDESCLFKISENQNVALLCLEAIEKVLKDKVIKNKNKIFFIIVLKFFHLRITIQ